MAAVMASHPNDPDGYRLQSLRVNGSISAYLSYCQCGDLLKPIYGYNMLNWHWMRQ